MIAKLAATAALAVTATLLAPAGPTSAAPYGGCKEAWQAPHSQGADWCRDRGWTVRPRFVLTPHHRVVFNRLPACAAEDSRGCYWNAQTMGNGEGRSFITGPGGRTWYVRF